MVKVRVVHCEEINSVRRERTDDKNFCTSETNRHGPGYLRLVDGNKGGERAIQPLLFLEEVF